MTAALTNPRAVLLCIVTAAQEGRSTGLPLRWERVSYLAARYGAAMGLTREEIEQVADMTLRDVIEWEPTASPS